MSVKRVSLSGDQISKMGSDLVTMRKLLTIMVEQSLSGHQVDVTGAQAFLEKRFHHDFRRPMAMAGHGADRNFQFGLNTSP